MTATRQSVVYSTERRPAIRITDSFVYDTAIRRHIIFGGIDSINDALGDTWHFDPIARLYLKRHPATSPSMRRTPMAYDTAISRSVIFGGIGAADILGDTWAYDGSASSWVDLNPATPGQKRGGHAIAYDSIRRRHVMFGGVDVTFALILADLQELDTAILAWSAPTPITTGIYEAPPAARFLHKMAFDATRGLTVMVGGLDDGFLPLAETWLWDGTGWRQQLSALHPPLDQMAENALAYVASLGGCILFGGGVFPTTGNDRTWFIDADGWREIFPVAALPSPERRSLAGASDGKLMHVFGGNNTLTTFNELFGFGGADWNEVRAGFEFDNSEIPPIELEIAEGARLLNVP